MFRHRLLLVVLLLLAAGARASTLAEQKHEVERIRGLKFLHDVKVVTLQREQLPAAMREQMAHSLPYSFDDYVLTLKALHLIEPAAAGLQERMIDLLQQQVLAFYDPLTHVYYALDKPPEGLPELAKALPLEDATAVHELTHALQDQHFGIGKTDLALRDDWDAGLALHAVIEGDASLVMLAELVAPMGQTLETIVANDMLLQAMSSAATLVSGSTAGTPRYVVESLTVPYIAGLRFVAMAYRRGGWDAVNRIYADPPRSMREVLHPEEYFAGRRTPNALAAAPAFIAPGHLTTEHLGEWHWRFLLGDDSARGWTGDQVEVVQNDFCDPTVLVETQWESPERARAFRDAYAAFLAKEKTDAVTYVSGASVRAAWGADYALIDRFMTR